MTAAAAATAASAIAASLVPLHDASEASYPLPNHGSITIGRRAANGIVCTDVAVSGTHCIIRRKVGSGLGWIEVEDSSTNGTYVNDTKLQKGEKTRITHGDLLTLTRPDALAAGANGRCERVQFRLEAPGFSTGGLLSSQDAAGFSTVAAATPAWGSANSFERPQASATEKTSFERPSGGASFERPPAFVTAATTAEGFAQDLLIAEQHSKAKITGELLLIRRKLDEERARGETLRRELRTARSSIETERSRRAACQEARDTLQKELDELRYSHQELAEMQTAQASLQNQQDDFEVELGAQLQRCTSMEAAQERLRADLEEATGSAARGEAQLAEVQAKLHQATEYAEQLQRSHQETRREAEVARERVDRLHVELSSERAAREHLEDQAALLSEDAERAERGCASVQEALAAATAQRQELESRMESCRAEAEAARATTRDLQARCSEETEQATRFCNAASRMTEAMHQYVDQWARSLSNVSTGSGGASEVAMGTTSVVQTAVGTACDFEVTMRPASPIAPSTPKLTYAASGPSTAPPAISGGPLWAVQQRHGEDDNKKEDADDDATGPDQEFLEVTPVKSTCANAEDHCDIEREREDVATSREVPSPREEVEEDERIHVVDSPLEAEAEDDGRSEAHSPTSPRLETRVSSGVTVLEPAHVDIHAVDRNGPSAPSGMLSLMVGGDDSPLPPPPPPPLLSDDFQDIDEAKLGTRRTGASKRAGAHDVLLTLPGRAPLQKRRRSIRLG
eukprot:TRINITY_DN75115_c0_g1_i1.p1 TRINITY_DN75115_c0_g1~~TRINITY_DN75115_c0_g1_i1.p1  ORF type:complete len:745 (+),score=171.08 TRINITY_DN75115_c0_g1_i1:159-2393(+)